VSIAARLRHELVVEQYTEGADTPRGHKAITYVDGETIQGLVQEQKSSSGSAAELTGPDFDEVVVAKANVFLPIDAPVTERDRLRIVATGARYELIGPLRDAGGRGRHLEVEARRIKP
jgi:hypothetical protein